MAIQSNMIKSIIMVINILSEKFHQMILRKFKMFLLLIILIQKMQLKMNLKKVKI